jgi:hypothetical protein
MLQWIAHNVCNIKIIRGEFEMDEFEIRAKAAEISVNLTAHVVAAVVVHGGLGNLNELDPLRIAPEIEEYIRTGKVPDAIKVEKRGF